MVACDSTNSVNWKLSSSHIYDEIPKSDTALGWDLARWFPYRYFSKAFDKWEEEKKIHKSRNPSFPWIACAVGYQIFFPGIAVLTVLQTFSTLSSASKGTKQKQSFLPSPSLHKRVKCTSLKTNINKCKMHFVMPHNGAGQLYTK